MENLYSDIYYYFVVTVGIHRKSSDKQFNYRKLRNETGSIKVKPQRPPQPKVHQDANKEGVLIDISPEERRSAMSNSVRSASSNLSILDEPIDVAQEGNFLFSVF